MGPWFPPTGSPLVCNGCSEPFTVDHVWFFKKGGIKNIHHNILKKKWVDLCGLLHTPSAVNNQPPKYWVAKALEAPPTGGISDQRKVTKSDTYRKERNVVADIRGDMGVLRFWYPCSMSVFELKLNRSAGGRWNTSWRNSMMYRVTMRCFTAILSA